ncbi:hypothetical protein ES332_D11G231100v1 [Gossypium tomentosum]|uniref:Uncharacterized protein n=1 Tax=Gossypium tomentosum TaxID=34277 RepID=A0A5D2IR72_GOSTO|nr:hypothetical protein ES332_D11G231100v1 [Gossypium tomentosum]
MEGLLQAGSSYFYYKMSSNSHDVVGEGKKRNIHQTCGLEPSADLGATGHAARDAFVKMMERWFDQFIGTTHLPPP